MLQLWSLMRKAANFTGFSVLLVLALLLSSISSVSIKPVSAHPGKLMWSIVDTPSPNNNVIVSPSEINVIAIGSDGRTFYAVDIPAPHTLPDVSIGKVYKSTDGGVTWMTELSANLAAAGAGLPVWNLAVAPDDVNFLVAVTDVVGGPSGPQRVFVSEDGGANWENTNFTAVVGEYISCVDISLDYGGNRDIAIGTRDGAGGGRVLVRKYPGFGVWADQTVPPSDVVALKFSPTYASDLALAIIYSNASGTYANVGIRDMDKNTTNWTVIYGATPPEVTAGAPGSSPTASQIITADLELPSDFSGQGASNLRRFYVSTDAIAPAQSGVYRVDDTMVYGIRPPVTAPTTGRISSIAYWGTWDSGVLLAGEVTAGVLISSPNSSGVYVWRTSNPNQTVGVPTWTHSDARKSPTGGDTSNLANAQVAWSSDGTKAYCGTSSACLGVFTSPIGIICAPPAWPGGYLKSVPLDESAFSVSPYASAYGQLVVSFGKTEDTAIGNIWNQLSLIDTEISQLSDVAALEVPEAAEAAEAPTDYNILYLVSMDTGGFANIWRSTSDPPGRTWERILRTVAAATTDDLILRVKQPAYDETVRSQVIVYADLHTQTVGYSSDEGQFWYFGPPFPSVTDLTLASDSIMYILSASFVYRYERVGTTWQRTHEVHSELDSGHTIAVPLKNPEKDNKTQDWVIVGEGGPGSFSRVAWADFSQLPVKFEPPVNMRVEVPVLGDVHVIADDKFEQNKTVYAASHDVADTGGKIYRWVIDKSTAWDRLEPPNSAFYGLAQRNDVLYGAWINAESPGVFSDTGADRTLFPRVNVPPPPEWDYLTAGLPVGVFFTREPSSLKISSNEYNNLWAIDDDFYNWTNQTGCLWGYTDMMSKVGPWTTSPASGDSIPVDPVSGRAIEVNFGWRQLSYSSVYELQLAKDSDFSIVVLKNENIVPVDQLAPGCYFPAGGLVPTPASGIANWGNLESGHTYYWRVRARAAVTGEAVRSPWSATMYFTVMTGLPVKTKYPTLTLFSPTYGARNVSRSPSFSWSGMPKTTKYEFVLAKDAALTKVVVKANVPTTAYIYGDKLDWNTTYFWQVRAFEPVVSDPSPIGIFTVVAEKKPVTPEVETPAPIPSWVWWIIAVFTALVVVIIAFTMVKPSYIRPGGGKLFKVEPIADKPEKPMVKPAGGKLDNLKPIVNKLKSRIAKIWESITMAVRRLRNFRKRGDDDSGDNPEEAK
jgi:hypothetical protein